MTNTKPKRKTRSDKFPLTLHKTGQYCKKIKGKIYYFGANKNNALLQYLEQAAYLHVGKEATPKSNSSFSIKTLCNLYLDHQDSRVVIGEIKRRHLNDQTLILRNFAKFIGSNHPVSNITTIDLQNFRKKLIKKGKAAHTINNAISTIKAMYNWAMNNEVVDSIPNLSAIKKISNPKVERPTFTMPQYPKA